ncbi:acyl-CoA thioesterase, partial [Arthrobacter sp. H5]|uniref:acyl-CoA thioesterase n=1 Tax=Arthrobacter sp. H5 TaxID=1267973 RepID=UPI0009DD5874
MGKTQKISCEVPLRWGDMDAYGHINNVQVIRILEEARIHAFGPPGGTGAPGEQPPVALFSAIDPEVQAVVVEHRVKYAAALDYRNIPLKVQVWIGELKPASFSISYLIHDPVTDRMCVKAETVLAFLDQTGGLLRLTGEQKAQLLPYVGKPVFDKP